MSAPSQCVLVVDVGVTNARFATAKNGMLGAITNFKVADFPSFVAALWAMIVLSFCVIGAIIVTAVFDFPGLFFAHVFPAIQFGRIALDGPDWTIA
jgi:glucokinase